MQLASSQLIFDTTNDYSWTRNFEFSLLFCKAPAHVKN